MESGAVTYIKLDVDLVIDGKPVRYSITGEPHPGISIRLDPTYADHGTIMILDQINLALTGTLHDCTLHVSETEPDELPELPAPRPARAFLRAL